MDFALTSEQVELRDLAQSFTDKEITPNASRWDLEEQTPLEALRAAGELGLPTVGLPEKYGGGGEGLFESVLVAEEIAYGCAGFASSFTLNELPATAILAAGTEEQQEHYVGRICDGAFASYGLTEPGAGSDVAGISTRATRTSEGYKLSGSKIWITNSPFAEFFVIFAKTAPDEGRKGISAFLVEADTPGLTVGSRLSKMGQKAAPAAEVFLDDVLVGHESLLGSEGDGHGIAMQVFDRTRPVIASIAVGLMRRCLDESMSYAADRITMGQQLSRHQAIAFKLAEMATSIEASRLLTRQAAWLNDQGTPSSKHAAFAKLMAADAAVHASSEAIQIFGGLGYSQEYPVEKLYRDSKLFQIYEGTSEIQRLIITRELMTK